MRIGARTPLRDVALGAGQALADHDIRAILTGGACATIYSAGAYTSEGVDFVLEGSVLPAELDAAVAGLGYRRDGNRYVHARSPFWIEFPRGPLAIGADLRIEPCVLGDPGRRSLALSPTDSCRDRLAAFLSLERSAESRGRGRDRRST